MDVSYINPFIESVNEFFTTMLSAEAKRGPVSLSDDDSGGRHVVALIGLSGPTRGTVALHLPTPTALSIVNRLLDSDTRVMDETTWDGVAEVVNIIAGGAKARFPKANDQPVQLSLPTVVKGRDYRVEYPTKSTWIEVPFQSDLGEFKLRVTLESNGKANGGVK